MAHYRWKGPGKLEQTNTPRAGTPDLEEPADPDVEGAGEEDKTQLFMCEAPDPDNAGQVCKRKFKKRMILARHFNSTHDDIREDSDSWREYVAEVWE